MNIDTLISELDCKFSRIHRAPYADFGRLRVGDYVQYIIGFERVTRVSDGVATTTSGRYSAAARDVLLLLTRDDAQYMYSNWDAYRVWLIEGVDGLRKRSRQVAAQADRYEQTSFLEAA